jgi:Leucine-rich repeat (LRR) protein
MIGGGSCSICKSPNTSKVTCPCNPSARNIDYNKHSLWKTVCPEKKPPGEKSPEKKSPEKKSPEKKSPEKKSPEKKSPEKKSPEKKSSEKKSPEKKSPKKKSPEKESAQNDDLESLKNFLIDFGIPTKIKKLSTENMIKSVTSLTSKVGGTSTLPKNFNKLQNLKELILIIKKDFDESTLHNLPKSLTYLRFDMTRRMQTQKDIKIHIDFVKKYFIPSVINNLPNLKTLYLPEPPPDDLSSENSKLLIIYGELVLNLIRQINNNSLSLPTKYAIGRELNMGLVRMNALPFKIFDPFNVGDFKRIFTILKDMKEHKAYINNNFEHEFVEFILKYASNLEILTIDNAIKFPENIFSLKNLKQLAFANAAFETIPPKIKSLSSLQIFSIILSPLSSLPPEIGELSNLHLLNLVLNRHLKTLPDEIVNLKNLVGLYLENNQLETLPINISQLNATISIRGNPISKKFTQTQFKASDIDKYIKIPCKNKVSPFTGKNNPEDEDNLINLGGICWTKDDLKAYLKSVYGKNTVKGLKDYPNDFLFSDENFDDFIRSIRESAFGDPPGGDLYNYLGANAKCYKDTDGTFDFEITGDTFSVEMCDNDIDAITQMPFDGREPIISIKYPGQNKYTCYEREGFLQFVHLDNSTMFNWVKKRDETLDDVGYGGEPGNKCYRRTPDNYYLTSSSVEFIKDNPDVTLYKAKKIKDNERIGNWSGYMGMSRNHGQLPGFPIYKLIPLETKISNENT